ncbi:MAG: PDZ domain-containing protein [Cyclobacteriaceae bacterium]|nr:PDZ domain-containing protein [Cyclobacteriaceae bacterium]
MNRSLICFFMLMLLAAVSIAQNPTLKRKAQLDFRVRKISDSPGARVTSVNNGSPAYKAGLRAGDVVLTINSHSLPDENVLYQRLWALRGGDQVKLTMVRNNQTMSIAFTPAPAPLETYKSLDVEAIALTNNSGDLIRAFVTKPKDAKGKLPAILFVSWLSCSSVELPERDDSWTKMQREVAEKSGALMMRIEKPGVGDSEGPPCAECDLHTELDGYKAAWRHLKQRSDVDTTNIIVFGASLGGTLASIVGKGQPVKAYVSAVSVYKTWLEHMIELERRRLQYSGKTQREINTLMPAYIEFHSDYMNYRKTPEHIIQEKPHLASIWYDEPRHQYGRPAKFYMQIQDFNFLETWGDTSAPVLFVAGEYDWIMSVDDSQIVTDMINKKTPGRATRYVAKGMDHHWSVYANPQNAFDEVNGTYAQETVTEMIAWIKKMIAQP